MNKEEILNIFLLANIPEIITQEEFDDVKKAIKELQQEKKQLKDNWNYIKKMLKEARQEEFNITGYCGTCTDVDIDFLLNKMQELEGSDK